MFILLDRPQGGDRAIGLSVAPLRIWSKLRRPLATDWETEHNGSFLCGATGRPCEKAAWSLSVYAGAAQEPGGAGAAFFLDLEKFYETVQHPSALEQARRNTFPIKLMRLALASYRGWRSLQYGEVSAIPFCVTKTIIAGCSLATSLAKVLVRLPMRAALSKVPSLKLWNVVDDISGFIGGPRRLVTHLLPVAIEGIAGGLERQGFKLSRGNSKALVWGLGDSSAALWARLGRVGIQPADAVRSVGVDLVGSHVRQVPILKQRLAKAAGKSFRHLRISNFDHRAAVISAAGAKAAAVWVWPPRACRLATSVRSRRCW